MKFILHVWTKDIKAGPWIVHLEDNLVQWIAKSVRVNVPSYTMVRGHEPCANWYIQGTYHSFDWDPETETATIS